MTEAAKNRLLTLAGIAIAIGALYFLRSVTMPIIVAAMIAYLLDPLIDKMEERKLGRSTSIFILLSAFIVSFITALLLLVPAIEAELATVVKKLPAYMNTLKDNAIPLIERLLASVFPGDRINLHSLLPEGKELVSKIPVDFWKRVVATLTSTLKGTFSIVISLIGTMIIPLYIYYLLKDFDNLKNKVLELVPPGRRGFIKARGGEIDTVLSAFIRGQAIVCLILAIFYTTGLLIIGLDLAFIIGIISGAAFIIPYLGTALGILLASLFAFLQFGDVIHLVYVVILYGVAQAVEGTLLTPRIVGDKVGLHPLAVIIAVITGGELFGFTGILLAIPVAAILKIFIEDALESYQKSSYFKQK